MPFLLTATLLALGLPRRGLPVDAVASYALLVIHVLLLGHVLLSEAALSVRCRAASALGSRCAGSEGGMMGGSLASASTSSCRKACTMYSETPSQLMLQHGKCSVAMP